ncbi:MAG: DMT family transporter [Bacteroidaceae bacterium]|nr:DMT family transporter [Bacteroidaceae bacterium]
MYHPLNIRHQLRHVVPSKIGYHFLAFLTIVIWGSTFVFTKMLLQNGLSPAQIFTLRFIVAYVLMLIGSLVADRRFKLLADSWLDEFVMLLLGITGGSMYFLTENASMLYTTATNTSLIVCTCPLFAMLLIAIVYRQTEQITRLQALGSLIACLGMAVVVLNGHFVLHLSPKGDLLALAACLCWAFYSLLMKPVLQRYDTLFITRKVFFYGLVTIIPYYIFEPGFPSLEVLLRPHVLWNLLFLSVVASMLCFIMWNWVIGKLGVVVATNWVYFNPITTILFAWWLLHEQITSWFLLGSCLILLGMLLSDRK